MFLFSLSLSLFLSLSLSLSLSENLLLAPKQKKSTPARNSRHGSESSSSALPPIPSHIQFCDEKAKMNFFENFQAMVFIWNARSFDRISPTLRYPMSFGLKDGNLYVRNLCVVLSCLYRSSTPTYTTLIPLCLSSLCNSEVHV